jgi:hypothetical protein
MAAVLMEFWSTASRSIKSQKRNQPAPIQPSMISALLSNDAFSGEFFSNHECWAGWRAAVTVAGSSGGNNGAGCKTWSPGRRHYALLNFPPMILHLVGAAESNSLYLIFSSISTPLRRTLPAFCRSLRRYWNFAAVSLCRILTRIAWWTAYYNFAAAGARLVFARRAPINSLNDMQP